MKNRLKLLILVLSAVIFSGSVVSTFGISPFETEATLDSSGGSFEIGLLNTGGERLNVSFSAENVSEGRVTFDSKSVVLEPSEVRSSPSGSGWYYVGGEYVEMKSSSLSYVPEEPRRKEEYFKVEVLAEPLNASGPDYGPEIAQVREISYRVRFEETVRSGTWNTLEGDQQTTQRDETENSEEDDQERRNFSDTASRQDNSTRTVKPSESEGFNELTVVLLAGSLITAVYIYYLV